METNKATVALLRRLIKAHTHHRPKKDTKKANLLHIVRHRDIHGKGTDANPYILRYKPYIQRRYKY